MLWRILAVSVLILATTVQADSILLDDGTTISGTIIREGRTRVVIQTEFGRKSVPKRRIKSMVRDADVSLPRGTLPEGIQHFENLDVLSREVANARALYALGRYDEIIPRLSPLQNAEDKRDEQYELRWLIIYAHQRLGSFDEAITMLKEMKAAGRETDQIRATAHLDIFDQNPEDRSFRRVGRVLTRQFLSREERLKAKEPNALADETLMRRALEEYCDQLLVDEKVSTRAVERKLDLDLTLEAFRDLPRAASRLDQYLPFAEDVRKVRASLDRVEAILPGYAQSYEVALVRSLAMHLYDVLEQLFTQTLAEYPEPTPSGDERGNLTPEERKAWREYCQNFDQALRPLLMIAEYMQERVAKHPENLRYLNDMCRDIIARLEQVRATTNKKRGRTRV